MIPKELKLKMFQKSLGLEKGFFDKKIDPKHDLTIDRFPPVCPVTEIGDDKRCIKCSSYLLFDCVICRNCGEVNNFTEISLKEEDFCSFCGYRMMDKFCTKCGCYAEHEKLNDIYDHFNSCESSLGHLRLDKRCAGVLGSKFNRMDVRLLNGCKVDYSTRREYNLNHKIENIVYQSDIAIPTSILNEASAEIEELKKNNYYYRSNKHNGLVVAIIYMKCRAQGIHRSVRILSQIFTISKNEV